MKVYWFRLEWEDGRVVSTEKVGGSPSTWKRGQMTSQRSHILACDELDAFMLANKKAQDK